MEERDIIIYEVLIPSLQRLYKVDYQNIFNGVSERNICARLAHHIENMMRKYDREYGQRLFYGYYSDVEYDKMNGRDPKRYEDRQHEGKRMISDLLIHSRGVPRNYLAVEMKCKKNYRKRREDRDRLKSMVRCVDNPELPCVYNTIVGVFVIYSSSDVKIEIYEDVNGQGEKTNELWFDYHPNGNQSEVLIVR